MKRTHSTSNIPPYHFRESTIQQRVPTNQTSLPPEQTQPDFLTVLPTELLFSIFFSSTSSFEDLRFLALTCKTFNTVVSNNTFGKEFLETHKIPLKTQEKESWFKTYRLWLQTNCYILLDCSTSMEAYTLKEKTNDIINKIATDAFNNKWRKGITLGVFADEFTFAKFKTIVELTSFLRGIDEFLENSEIGRTETCFLPLITDIYTKVNLEAQDNAPPTELHVLSDYIFNEDKIIPYLRDTFCCPPIKINFYDINKSINSVSIFLSKIKDLQGQFRKTKNRAALSFKD